MAIRDWFSDRWQGMKDFASDPIYETRQNLGKAANAANRAGKAVISPLNPVGWVRNLMRRAPVLGVLLGAGAGAGLYSHFAQPQVTSLPEADADALAAAQAQAQRDFLDQTPAMQDPRIAPMQQAIALKAQMEGEVEPKWADKMTAAREPKPLYAANEDLPTMNRAEPSVGAIKHTGTVPVASLSQYGVPAPQQALGA